MASWRGRWALCHFVRNSLHLGFLRVSSVSLPLTSPLLACRSVIWYQNLDMHFALFLLSNAFFLLAAVVNSNADADQVISLFFFRCFLWSFVSCLLSFDFQLFPSYDIQPFPLLKQVSFSFCWFAGFSWICSKDSKSVFLWKQYLSPLILLPQSQDQSRAMRSQEWACIVKESYCHFILRRAFAFFFLLCMSLCFLFPHSIQDAFLDVDPFKLPRFQELQGLVTFLPPLLVLCLIPVPCFLYFCWVFSVYMFILVFRCSEEFPKRRAFRPPASHVSSSLSPSSSSSSSPSSSASSASSSASLSSSSSPSHAGSHEILSHPVPATITVKVLDTAAPQRAGECQAWEGGWAEGNGRWAWSEWRWWCMSMRLRMIMIAFLPFVSTLWLNSSSSFSQFILLCFFPSCPLVLRSWGLWSRALSGVRKQRWFICKACHCRHPVPRRKESSNEEGRGKKSIEGGSKEPQKEGRKHEQVNEWLNDDDEVTNKPVLLTVFSLSVLSGCPNDCLIALFFLPCFALLSFASSFRLLPIMI